MGKISIDIVKQLRNSTGAPLMECKRALTETHGDLEEAKVALRKKGKIIALKKSSREANEGIITIAISDNKKKAALLKLACETDFVASNNTFCELGNKLTQLALTQNTEDIKELSIGDTSVSEIMTNSITELGENIVIKEVVLWNLSDDSILGSYVHSNSKIGVLVELSTKTCNDDILNLAKDVSMHIAANQVQAIQASEIPAEIIDAEKNFLIEQAKDSGKDLKIVEKMIEGRLRKYKQEICLLEQPFVRDSSITIEQLLEKNIEKVSNPIKVVRFYKSTF